MGHIIKKIIGDFSLDRDYNSLTIEDNADGKVHIHIKNLRLDLTRTAYNQLREGVVKAKRMLEGKHS